MFRFQHVEYFWFLLLIPVIILVYLYFLSWRRRNLKKLGESSFIKELINGKINGRLTTKVALISVAAICLILALTNLQSGGHAEKTERKGLDVVFALDVSNSMLAQDISPNRLTKAKELIYRTLAQMHNDRTGLVVFAGNAYLQVPLTVDYGAMKMLLASVSPGMIPTQGTNFSDAIRLADKSFSQKDKKNKVLVLISDGEDHDESAVDAAKAAAEQGLIIYTVGIGSPQGSTIIDPTTRQPKVDEQGNVVVTKLNEAELQDIAGATGGRYQLLQNAGRVSENLVNAIAQLGTKNLGAVVYTDYDSYFQYFLGASLILFFIAFLLPDAQKMTGKDIKVQSKNMVSGAALIWMGILIVATLGIPQQLWAQQQSKQPEQKPDLALKKSVNSGNDFYHKKQYDSAGAQYLKALKAQPNSFEGNFNMGDALYQSGQYDKARAATTNSLKSAKTKEDQAAAYHNIGNSFLKQRQWQQAAEAFKKSLLLQPKDQDAKYNLAYAQEMLKQQQQDQKDNKNKDKKDNKDKQNKKDKQDKQQSKDSQDKQNQNQQQKKDQDKQKKEEQNQQQNQQPKNGDKDKKEQQQQSRPSKLNKKQAENILNALNQEEQALHKRKKEQTGVPVQPGKDW